MATMNVLIPYNFTVHDGKAVEFTVNVFSHLEDVRVTLFHTYIPVPQIDMTGSPELGKMKSGLLYLTEEIRKKEAGLNAALHYLERSGFPRSHLAFILKKRERSTIDEIIAAILEGHHKIVVLSITPGKVSRLFARSLHDQLMNAVKEIVVCVAT
ncbi:MAG: hypothetical protein CVU57_08250 [Deltaproteobacteria bacterium HGW-Deltaproteobacteria-15]|jgi:hypothetical protein|nr:MAG: hypothetical protein CVU57_08250 [Deltaproteobacteria bacterium HGW-Deltaproteobacteria-15]